MGCGCGKKIKGLKVVPEPKKKKPIKKKKKNIKKKK